MGKRDKSKPSEPADVDSAQEPAMADSAPKKKSSSRKNKAESLSEQQASVASNEVEHKKSSKKKQKKETADSEPITSTGIENEAVVEGGKKRSISEVNEEQDDAEHVHVPHENEDEDEAHSGMVTDVLPIRGGLQHKSKSLLN
jgi:hypothetical protein